MFSFERFLRTIFDSYMINEGQTGQHPYSVRHGEVERSHPHVFNCLSQVLNIAVLCRFILETVNPIYVHMV